MDTLFNLEIIDLKNSSPCWFDYLALILTLLVSFFSIWGSYRIAENVYKKEKKNKNKK